jgi:hypothetical protein
MQIFRLIGAVFKNQQKTSAKPQQHYLQLAFAQTPSLRLGVHQHGEFIELRKWMLDGHDA